MPWDDVIKLVAPGEPVAAAVPNRPLAQLDGNLRYLRDLVDAAHAGESLFSRGVPVEPAAAPGMPVYYNAASGRYERALLAVTAEPLTGLLRVADSARVTGVVLLKTDAATADLVRVGSARLDLTAAAGSNAPGLYFLSSSTPGGLTTARPAVGVPVLSAEGNGRVFVCPQLVDPNNDALTAAATAVSSLASADPKVRVTCAGTTTPASSGPLQIAVDLGLAVNGAAERGVTALGRLDGATQTLYKTVVTEGVWTDGTNVTLTSDQADVPSNPSDPGSPPLKRGRVRIRVATQSSYELDPQLTWLRGAIEDSYGGVLFLTLPRGVATYFTSKFRVPDTLPFTSPAFKYELRLLGKAAGTLPGLTVTALVLPRPGASPVALPTSPVSVAVTTNKVLSAGYTVAEATATPFAVTAGATVFVTVARGASDGYASDVGRVEEVGVLVEGS